MLFLGSAGATLPVWGLQPRGLQSPLGPQLPSLPTTTMSGWLATTILSVWIWKSHRIFALSFSTTFGGVFHLYLGTSSPYSAQMLRYTIPATWLYSMCALPASILHPDVMCCTVSGMSLHSLNLGSCLVWQTPASMDLVFRACSCAAMISTSVLSFSPALT